MPSRPSGACASAGFCNLTKKLRFALLAIWPPPEAALPAAAADAADPAALVGAAGGVAVGVLAAVELVLPAAAAVPQGAVAGRGSLAARATLLFGAAAATGDGMAIVDGLIPGGVVVASMLLPHALQLGVTCFSSFCSS